MVIKKHIALTRREACS